jgi:hypothetical protein
MLVHLQLLLTWKMADLKVHYGVNQILLLSPGKNATESVTVLEAAFLEQTVGRTPGLKLFSKFRSGVTSVDVAIHLGHPSLRRTDGNVN